MNLRIFTLDEFVVSNILTIPRIYGAKDCSVDKDISGLALRGKTLETDTMASGLLRPLNVSCTPLFQALQKILPHTSEPSNPSLSCFTILWRFVKSHRLSINNFVTIIMANWHTIITYSTRNCFLCRHIGNCTYPILAFELRVTSFLSIQISWERAILHALLANTSSLKWTEVSNAIALAVHTENTLIVDGICSTTSLN